MGEFFNRFEDNSKRKRLRLAMPKAEIILWSRLKGGQLKGLKFRRQYGVGPFVIDFYCPEHKLAIELDGDSHCTPEAEKYDQDRQSYIESFGIKFLRFTNADIYENLGEVLWKIAEATGV
ncbi:endonuclease domain-containing protein [Candidatus Peregrinibacteria bacterium]|nr:endonuclease domain-containing protein [Candidatus Peregrinibacteria bacterium]